MRFLIVLCFLFPTLNLSADSIKLDSSRNNHIDTIVGNSNIENKAIHHNSNDLFSPYHTLKFFQENTQGDTFKPEIVTKCINFESIISQKNRKEIVIKLRRIIDASGLIIRLDDYPRDNNFLDSSTMTHSFYPFARYPELYLEKKGRYWVFSRETSLIIENLHDEIFPVAVDEFVGSLPDFFHKSIIGIKYWQWIGLFIYLLISSVLFYIFSSITGKLIYFSILRFNKGYIADIFIKKAAKPSSILIVCLLIEKYLPLLELPFALNITLIYSLKVFIPINIVFILIKLVDLLSFIFARLASKTSSKVDDHLVPFARKALKGIVIILGCFYILQLFEIDITPLIAGVSIGGLAFALAAQDTIKNVFGSFTIFTDQPFNIGDWIVFDGGEGMVEEVGTRSTRIRTFANSLITIPNGRLGDMTINNMGKRKMRRFSTSITITYDTTPEKIELFVNGIRELILKSEYTHKDTFHVYLNNFGSFSLDILLYVFFEVNDWASELKARHSLMIEIIKLAEKLGVRFAFPTQTLHVEEMPTLKISNQK